MKPQGATRDLQAKTQRLDPNQGFSGTEQAADRGSRYASAVLFASASKDETVAPEGRDTGARRGHLPRLCSLLVRRTANLVRLSNLVEDVEEVIEANRRR